MYTVNVCLVEEATTPTVQFVNPVSIYIPGLPATVQLALCILLFEHELRVSLPDNDEGVIDYLTASEEKQTPKLTVPSES